MSRLIYEITQDKAEIAVFYLKLNPVLFFPKVVKMKNLPLNHAEI